MRSVNDMLRLRWTGQREPKECAHLSTLQDVEPASDGCIECIELGDTYPDTRMCLVCGYVGCCDGAKNKHMKKHVEETGHQIVAPNASREWIWCYADEARLDPP